jgi:dTDP-4-amino-4,6-dideoxygalactose transaminase
MRKKYLVFGAPHFSEATIDEVVDSLRSGWIGTGPKVARLEQMVSEYTGAAHTVAVNSCTAALHLSLLAADVGPGDEVITTPMTFCATANSIIHTGARPVFVDCERDTQLIDPEKIEAAITSKTKAIVPVHFAGRVCDMNAIAGIAKRHNLRVIEDAAHAIEGRYNGHKVGSMSDMTCFSFYVTKNVTTGEGGMVATDDPELASRIKMQALHGMSRDAWKRFSDAGYKHYEVVSPGFKYNMMDLQAAIGIHQFDHVEIWLDRRNEIWQRYSDELKGLPVDLPAPDDPRSRHARHLYTLMIDSAKTGITRDEFMNRMHAKNIGTGVHYIGVHLHPWYRENLDTKAEDYPNATWISERTVSIPLSPHLDDDDVTDVINAIRESLGA